MVAEMGQFVDWVVAQTPTAPGFISDCASASPILFGKIFDRYVSNAGSSQWSDSNSFAESVPSMDQALSAAISDADAFKLIVAIVRGAGWNGFGPLELTKQKFSSLPHLRMKARSH